MRLWNSLLAVADAARCGRGTSAGAPAADAGCTTTSTATVRRRPSPLGLEWRRSCFSPSQDCQCPARPPVGPEKTPSTHHDGVTAGSRAPLLLNVPQRCSSPSSSCSTASVSPERSPTAEWASSPPAGSAAMADHTASPGRRRRRDASENVQPSVKYEHSLPSLPPAASQMLRSFPASTQPFLASEPVVPSLAAPIGPGSSCPAPQSRAPPSDQQLSPRKKRKAPSSSADASSRPTKRPKGRTAGSKHPCPHCSQQFTRRFTLKEHIYAKHTADNKNYVCPDCSQKFTRKYTLNRHLLTHDPERPKPFQCPACKIRFDKRFNLKRHMGTHPELARAIENEDDPAAALVEKALREDVDDHASSVSRASRLVKLEGANRAASNASRSVSLARSDADAATTAAPVRAPRGANSKKRKRRRAVKSPVRSKTSGLTHRDLDAFAKRLAEEYKVSPDALQTRHALVEAEEEAAAAVRAATVAMGPPSGGDSSFQGLDVAALAAAAAASVEGRGEPQLTREQVHAILFGEGPHAAFPPSGRGSVAKDGSLPILPMANPHFPMSLDAAMPFPMSGPGMDRPPMMGHNGPAWGHAPPPKAVKLPRLKIRGEKVFLVFE